jgi:hydrogenase maturation factor HypF (carbamoyltransferase family)
VSYNALNKLILNECNDQLSGLFALVATVLGLSKSGHDSVQYLNDALIAKSLHNADNQGHRVDFSLDMVDGKRTIDWAKMVGSLMSFCLVVDEVDYDKIAFGVMDSLADYIANWIERMDETSGIKAVTLAGSDFANEVLADRVCLRVGKNYPIVVNRKLELDGSNLSAGALFLKMRRR